DPILSDLGIAQAAAHIGLSLPIYVGTNPDTSKPPLLTVTLTDDLTDPLHPTITPDPRTIASDIAGSISLSNALRGAASAVNGLLGPVLDDVDADVLSDDLPLIGPGLAKAAHFLSDLKNDFVSAMNTVADTLDSVGPAIYAEFGPSSSQPWLQPIPN